VLHVFGIGEVFERFELKLLGFLELLLERLGE
jgi:hypothetical protein